MLLQVLALDGLLPALVGAGQWVALAHWPVDGCYVMVGGLVLVAVFTAEDSQWTLPALVLDDASTLVIQSTAIVEALHFHKGTPFQLLINRLGVDIQVCVQHFQLPPPLTPDLTVRAVDFKLLQGHIVGTVVRQDKVHLVAKRTGFPCLLNALDTLFTEVMAAAAGNTWGTEHKQTDGTLRLEVKRWVDKLALVTATGWLSIHPFSISTMLVDYPRNRSNVRGGMFRLHLTSMRSTPSSHAD